MYLNFKGKNLKLFKQYPNYLNGKGLSASDKIVYVHLLDRFRWTWSNHIKGNMDFYNGTKNALYCVYELSNLEEDTELSQSTIKRSIKALEQANMIETDREKKDKRNSANRYYLKLVEGMEFDIIDKPKEKTDKPKKPNKEPYNKTKFHNFDETFTQYSSDELDDIIEKSQKEKFK